MSGLYYSMYLVSEIRILFLNLLNEDKDIAFYFTKSKPNYNLTEYVHKRLVELVKIVPGLDKIMAEVMPQNFPNETAFVNNNYSYFEWSLFANDAKTFLEKRQREIYMELFEDCNNTALYLPKTIAYEVAGEK